MVHSAHIQRIPASDDTEETQEAEQAQSSTEEEDAAEYQVLEV